ncbi:hypothetical protein RZS28_03905 [Methylocapsa polymorpha]|uniref:Phage baseplate protein n=1 Tax=Methylocapsa polymorpha TaxID=3080828 RepID=A0ABZ0HVT1_9HYPH|nr:hypothetical protein RZS28_03905 [Methylocapsa sp. RX1]
MMTDGTAEMVRAYEDGLGASLGERGLILLRLVFPDETEASRASTPVGRRDAALLDLFSRMFGGVAEALTDCPRCGEKIEMEVPLDAIRAPAPTDESTRFTLTIDGGQIVYRLPNAGDLAALGAAKELGDVETARRALVRRCFVAKEDRSDLSEHDIERLAAAMSESVAKADPQAQVLLELDCPSCAARWSAPFDIVEFLWRRMEARVSVLLREVHVIASSYGWTEDEILALSPFRRRRYLELIGA